MGASLFFWPERLSVSIVCRWAKKEETKSPGPGATYRTHMFLYS